MEDFEYSLIKKDKSRRAFGSCLSREILPMRGGMSRFACKYTPELLLKITPTLYNTSDIKSAFSSLRTKIVSKKGVGGLVCRDTRFKYTLSQGPDPTAYNTETFPSPVKLNKYPFNSSTIRFLKDSSKNPGVGSYNIATSRKQQISCIHSFGGRKIIDSGADIKCCAINHDICKKCGNIPVGDYWHLNYDKILCRRCKFEEDLSPSVFSIFELQNFRKIRDCSFQHSHEGTSAAVILMNKHDFRQLKNKEVYFTQYYHERKGKILGEDPDQVLPWHMKRYEFKFKK